MAPERLIVTGTFHRPRIIRACGTDIDFPSLLPVLRVEYWRIRHLSWLYAAKYFTSARDFWNAIMRVTGYPYPIFPPAPDHDVHRLADYRQIAFPATCNALNGFDSMVLDFSAREYFALFDVS
jgi:hypothetical protein